MRTTSTFVTLALLSIGLIAGCSSSYRFYDGPERPPEEVATLKPNPVAARIGFLVTAVNGTSTHVQMESLSVLPGEHMLELRITPTSMSEWANISGETARIARRYDMENRIDRTIMLSAEAGRRYGLDGRAAMSGPIESFWIYDMDTNQVIVRGSVD